MSDVRSNEINAMQMSQAAERMQEKNGENMWTLKYYISELLFVSFESDWIDLIIIK